MLKFEESKREKTRHTNSMTYGALILFQLKLVYDLKMDYFKA